MTKEEMIKTVIEFTKVKDIDIDYIYTDIEFYKFETKLIKEFGYVLGISSDGIVKVSKPIVMDCQCCSYSEDVYVPLSALTEGSLETLIKQLEDLAYQARNVILGYKEIIIK
jgi:hypothetical protein